MAKNPASVKGLKLLFRERMHENCNNICLMYLQQSVLEELISA